VKRSAGMTKCVQKNHAPIVHRRISDNSDSIKIILRLAEKILLKLSSSFRPNAIEKKRWIDKERVLLMKLVNRTILATVLNIP
jgi:hypothetical protein